MRCMGYGPSRPNVMPARFQQDALPEKVEKTAHDYCDKCGKLMLVYTKTLYKRRYRNKIYCENCYEMLSKEEKAFKGKETIQRGGRLIKDSDKKNDTPPITIIKTKPNTTCKFGVMRTNGVTITECKDKN